MEKCQLGDLMEKTMTKIREMVDVNTIVGQPIAADGTTLIPISKVSFGFASGGSEFPTKAQDDSKGLPFGGGSGAGVKITPVAFLVLKDENVRILNVMPPASTTIDRALEMAPEVIDKISALFQKDKEE